MNISGFQSSYCCCCKLSKYLYKLYFYALAILFNLKIIWFNAPWIDDVIPVVVWNIRSRLIHNDDMFVLFFILSVDVWIFHFVMNLLWRFVFAPSWKAGEGSRRLLLCSLQRVLPLNSIGALFQSEKIKINLVSPKKIAHEVKSGEIKACSPPVWQKNNNK